MENIILPILDFGPVLARRVRAMRSGIDTVIRLPLLCYDSAPMIKILPILLLIVSNIFMTYAWYGHLKDMRARPLIVAIIASWLVAFMEYCFQVPANRLGHQTYTLGQLKIMQEVITMVVFAFFSVLYMKEKITLDYLWASFCLMGAVYFIFRAH